MSGASYAGAGALARASPAVPGTALPSLPAVVAELEGDSSFMKCIDGAVDGDQGSVVRRGDPSTQSLVPCIKAG